MKPRFYQSRLAAKLLYYPSLLWDFVVCRIFRGLHHWDEIDQFLILGAFPHRRHLPALLAAGVQAVVNTCAESEGPLSEYERLDIEQLRIPVVDFTEPTLGQIRSAIEFIEQYRALGKTVYVHCKSGRGRSSTIVLCWLIHCHNLCPEVAQRRLQDRRGQVLRHLDRRDVVQRFWGEIQVKNG
ncbi:MAG: atypical dual specificity phosphatase [Mariniblastus sp.]